MENFIDTNSSFSPLLAILWCFYPIGILVLFELLLGGGIDDDNDDQDGGMLIPAYANAKNWTYTKFRKSVTKLIKNCFNLMYKFFLKYFLIHNIYSYVETGKSTTHEILFCDY